MVTRKCVYWCVSFYLCPTKSAVLFKKQFVMNYVDFKNKCCNIMCLICLFFLLYVEVPDVQFSKIFFFNSGDTTETNADCVPGFYKHRVIIRRQLIRSPSRNSVYTEQSCLSFHIPQSVRKWDSGGNFPFPSVTGRIIGFQSHLLEKQVLFWAVVFIKYCATSAKGNAKV